MSVEIVNDFSDDVMKIMIIFVTIDAMKKKTRTMEGGIAAATNQQQW